MISRKPGDAYLNYILSLTDISQGDVERVGAKAARLGELARASFTVPDGFVLTTGAFDQFLATLGPDISPEAVIAAPLPTDVADALLAATSALGDVLLAVRSSGTGEDLTGASFAGQYETVLDREWRATLLPHYQVLVAQSALQVEKLSAPDLIHLIEELASVSGDYFTSITLVAGFAWKAEMPLAAFYRKYLSVRIGGSYQQLLCGLSPDSLLSTSHAVVCLDWFHPTLAEQTSPTVNSPVPAAEMRFGLARTERLKAEAQARSALAREPKLLAQFEKLLAAAQRFGRIREEQVAPFTLGWPIMRRAVLRLGGIVMERGTLLVSDDVFFLTRAELLAALSASTPAGSLVPKVMARKKLWQRERFLTPPLVLGELTPMMQRIFDSGESLLRPEGRLTVGNALSGLPASPGRASGPARVIRTPEEFDRLQPGDVLIAPVTTPAWTPLFARAVAVVTDTGSPLAHASLAAREYGIPAVVGTGSATARLQNGQMVTVDGTTGLVEVQLQ